MNRAIEFHDSHLSSLDVQGQAVVLHFQPAYVHASEGEPGTSPGSGWLQEAQLVFQEAKLQGSVGLSGAVSEGQLEVQGQALGLLPVPFSARGEVRAAFVLSGGESFRVEAGAVELMLLGEPRYLEHFPGADG